jgi:hypothetical protein
MPFISSVRGGFGPLKKSKLAGDPEHKFFITGGSISVSGGYRIHDFTGVTSYTLDFRVTQLPLNTEYMVLAGGAGGWPQGPNNWGGGGGGAGGYRAGSLVVPGYTTQPVNVGGGGGPATVADLYTQVYQVRAEVPEPIRADRVADDMPVHQVINPESPVKVIPEVIHTLVTLPVAEEELAAREVLTLGHIPAAMEEAEHLLL